LSRVPTRKNNTSPSAYFSVHKPTTRTIHQAHTNFQWFLRRKFPSALDVSFKMHEAEALLNAIKIGLTGFFVESFVTRTGNWNSLFLRQELRGPKDPTTGHEKRHTWGALGQAISARINVDPNMQDQRLELSTSEASRLGVSEITVTQGKLTKAQAAKFRRQTQATADEETSTKDQLEKKKKIQKAQV